MNSHRDQKRVLLAMGEHYSDRVHYGVAEFAGRKGWHLTNLFGTSPDLIRERVCDGIIASLSCSDALSDFIARRRQPTVDVSIARKSLQVPHLTGDNFRMGQTAAGHFLERGFRNFVWFSERADAAAEQRRKGYHRALSDVGLKCTDLVVERAFSRIPPAWKDLNMWIVSRMKTQNKPIAVYAYNDVQAIDFLDVCVAHEIRVPDEVAILGTDNHPLVCPTAAVPLSSVNHDLERLGWSAAEELNKLMQGEPKKCKVIEIAHHGITTRQSTDVFAINDAFVVEALRYISENFRRNVGVADIVEASNTSRRSLERLFREHLEMSIHEKLMSFRMGEVIRLLRDTKSPISDIAASCGFSTPEYLHRVFLQREGTTPKKFRQQAE